MSNIATMPACAIDALERAMLLLPQADIRTCHEFLPGIYERTIIVPPWTVLTGAVHKTDYMVRVEAGVIAVTTDDGVKIFHESDEFNAKAGIRRVGCTFDKMVVWTDVYENPDDCRDILEIERRLYEIPEIGMFANRTPEQNQRLMAQAIEAMRGQLCQA